jgi:predicted PurR-regulated permease PerM
VAQVLLRQMHGHEPGARPIESAKGLALIAFGILVIGMVDNLLRPILVGKDTGLPEAVVLISTLGGLATFGLKGFVLGPAIAAMFVAVWHLPLAR